MKTWNESSSTLNPRLNVKDQFFGQEPASSCSRNNQEPRVSHLSHWLCHVCPTCSLKNRGGWVHHSLAFYARRYKISARSAHGESGFLSTFARHPVLLLSCVLLPYLPFVVYTAITPGRARLYIHCSSFPSFDRRGWSHTTLLVFDRLRPILSSVYMIFRTMYILPTLLSSLGLFAHFGAALYTLQEDYGSTDTFFDKFDFFTVCSCDIFQAEHAH